MPENSDERPRFWLEMVIPIVLLQEHCYYYIICDSVRDIGPGNNKGNSQFLIMILIKKLIKKLIQYNCYNCKLL